MRRSGRTPSPGPLVIPVLLLLTALPALPLPARAARQGGPDAPCSLCHGELEFLRQQAPTLRRARDLLVRPTVLRRSAHGDLACGACHAGFERYPHDGAATSTATCASCHGEADSAWASGVHAGSEPTSSAPCAGCHGVHGVEPVSLLADAPAVMNERCVACHATAIIAPEAPHGGDVACQACHAAHAVRRVEDPRSLVAAARQAATCGGCHDTVAAGWREDVHGRAVAEAAAGEWPPPAERSELPPPACTTCHGSHGMRRFTDAAPPGEVSRCVDCHPEYGDTFGDSYHGQAAVLGSAAAATCADCHTAHRILPASHVGSSVAPGRLVETCGACHPRASASFVQFEPHADPHDREKNPVLYWTYRFMTGLLLGVLGVFGLHALLWLVRLLLDGRGNGGPASPVSGPAGS